MQKIDGVNLENSLGLKLMDYVHPNEVVQDDRLPLMEKRTLLCAWASDACAVESRPGFRWLFAWLSNPIQFWFWVRSSVNGSPWGRLRAMRA